MKFIKRLFIAILVLLVLAIAAVAAVPIFFKDKLMATVKQEINNRVEGEVDFSDVSLSWFSSFPMMDLGIEDLHVEGYKVDSAQADLIQAEAIHLSFNPIELWKNSDELRITGFKLEDADIYLDQRAERSNFDIMKTTEEVATEEASSAGGQQMAFHLDQYAIEHTAITYVNHESGQVLKINDLNHDGRLAYLADGDIDWSGDLATGSTTFKDGAVAYLSKAALDYQGQVHVTEQVSRFTLEDNRLKVNELELALDGEVKQEGDDFIVDITTKTGQPEFKSLLSLMPALYTKDYKDLVADGRMSIAGTIKGRYAADGSSVPVYNIKAEVVDGAFKLPDLPKGVKDVNVMASLMNTAQDFMPERVDVPNFALLFDDQPVKGRVLLEDLHGAQRFDGYLDGHVDLAMIAETYPLPSVEELSGKLDIDMKAKGVIDQLMNEKYDELTLDGSLSGQAIHVKTPGQPAIDMPVVKAHLEGAGLELDEFELVQGDNRLSGTGSVAPILPIPNATYKVKADIKSPKFDLGPWMASDSETTASTGAATDDLPVAETKTAFPKVDLDLKAECGELLYQDFDMKDMKVGLRGSLDDMRLERSSMVFNGDLLEAEGRLRQTEDYLNGTGDLKGNLTMRADRLDINRMMGIDPSTEVHAASSRSTGSTPSTEYTVVPDHIDMDIKLSANQLIYDVYDLRKLNGGVRIQDQKIDLYDATANTLGGSVALKGSYEHDGRSAPSFAVTPKTNGVSIAQLIEKSGTMKFILPFLQFMDGELNTEMNLNGLLGEGYFPDLSTLTGNGLIETLHSTIKGNSTMNQLGQTLKIKELTEVAIEKSRNRFEIKEGKIFVQPFTQVVDDMHATISGFHGLDGNMNYDMKLVVPTEKFEKAGMPNSITKNLGKAASKLSSLGIDIGDTESIALDVSFTGALTNPQVKVGVADVSASDAKELVKEVANEIIEEAKDSVKTVAKDKTLEMIKKSTGDTTSTTIGEAAGKEVKDRLGKEGNAIIDSLGLGDEGKELLDKLNPFKKKKKKKK